VTTGDGNDTIAGDNGQIRLLGLSIVSAQTIDTVAFANANDLIDAGNGRNVVLGGVGRDTVLTGDGDDVVLGDNGTFILESDGLLQRVFSGDPLLGGNDLLSTGDGDDIAMGGAGSDRLMSDAGFDILFGDGGGVTSRPGNQIHLLSIDPLFGADDTIDGGSGAEIVVGGQADDLMFGSIDVDLLFGSNAAVTLVDGRVRGIESDTSDLATRALFESFDAMRGEEPTATGFKTEMIRDADETAAPAVRKLSAPFVDLSGFESVFDVDQDRADDARHDLSLFRMVFDSNVVTVVRSAASEAAGGAMTTSAHPSGESAGLALGVGIAPAGVPLNILTLSLVQGIADSGAPDIEEADGGAAVLDGFADVPFRMSHWRDLELALFFNRLGERPVEERTIVIYGTFPPSAR
jgi:Ca2+-binding RTX toxin-like protein